MTKKITFLINSLEAGGSERVVSLLANFLVKKYPVEIIVLEEGQFYRLDPAVKVTRLSCGPAKGWVQTLLLPILALKLKRYLRRYKISTLQSHLYRANFVNIMAKLFGSPHTAQIVNAGTISRYVGAGRKGKVNLFLISRLYPRADLVVWKSRGMEQDARRWIDPFPPSKVIYNPYDVELIQKLAREEVTEFEFNPSKRYLISVGRLIKLKRHRDQILALTQLPEEVELILIGRGEEEPHLRSLSHQLGVAHRVHFLGVQANPFKFIARSHLLIHTSESEGFPNVVVEGLICGVPAVVADCWSGPREILAPSTSPTSLLPPDGELELGEYGLLFPVGAVSKLVEGVNLLFSNPSLYHHYRQKGKERGEQFSIERIGRIYEKVLTDL